MTNATERIKQETINNATQQQARSQQEIPSDRPETEGSNLIENLGQLIANPLTQPVVNSVLKNLVLNVEKEVSRLVGVQPKEQQTNTTNPVIDVFVSSRVQSYGQSNVSVISSSSVSASLPSANISDGQTANGNGKGFSSKN